MPETQSFPTYLEHALADGHAEITSEARTQRIHYVAADRSERYADPEEKVRAELWAELIYQYKYPTETNKFRGQRSAADAQRLRRPRHLRG